MTDKAFVDWMRRVDRAVIRKSGCSVHDLADSCYRDWYDDEVKPSEAADMALAEEGFGDF